MKISNPRLFPTALAFGKRSSKDAFLAFIVKGTFGIGARNSVAQEAPQQLPILKADEPYDTKNPGGLLRFESDLVAFKPRADIVLVGNAYAPGGRGAKSVEVKVQVGRTLKIMAIFGDRVWSFPSADQSAPLQVGPAEFVKMPLTYDRAFGGIDEHAQVSAKTPRFRPWFDRNFFGRGFIGARTVASIHKKPLPNIEDPTWLIRTWDSFPPPTGCGFYPRNSMPRSSYLGTMDEKWKKQRAPEQPEDFCFGFFNGAHPELQVQGYLIGNEAVELTNVIAGNERAAFLLPGLRPVLTVLQEVSPSGGAPGTELLQDGKTRCYKIVPNLDTLVFIPDEEIFYQVWRAVIPIVDPAALDIEEIQVEYQNLPTEGHLDTNARRNW